MAFHEYFLQKFLQGWLLQTEEIKSEGCDYSKNMQHTFISLSLLQSLIQYIDSLSFKEGLNIFCNQLAVYSMGILTLENPYHAPACLAPKVQLWLTSVLALYQAQALFSVLCLGPLDEVGSDTVQLD